MGGFGRGGYEHKSHNIFIHKTHCHDLFYSTVYSHENIPNGIQNRGHCSFNHQGKITQKSERFVIIVRDTSP